MYIKKIGLSNHMVPLRPDPYPISFNRLYKYLSKYCFLMNKIISQIHKILTHLLEHHHHGLSLGYVHEVGHTPLS